MKLVVMSHKVCWRSSNAPSVYATDGGFAFQMRAISELFDETRLVIPVAKNGHKVGEVDIVGARLTVVPLTRPLGENVRRKLLLIFWLLRNLRVIMREIGRADAVHTPIPSDIGTIGLLIALVFGKPLLIRHCGNWALRRTAAEYFWRWLLERTAGDRTVVLATGGAKDQPSARNSKIHWIFSTSLRKAELKECGSVRSRWVDRSPRLIICCRQEREKGTGVVISSLPLLEREYPGISLDVVGDGSALDEFRRLAERYDVTTRVRFCGKVDHLGVMQLLKSADLFCFPTTSSEGFPKAVLEALACGLPVVTTRVSVLEELVGSGGGILLNEASPQEVARGIRWCLADLTRYQALSAAAIRIAGEYSLERWRDTIASVLIPGWGQLQAPATVTPTHP